MEEVQKKSLEVRTERETVKENVKEGFSHEMTTEHSNEQ
jgi:hypothetical protein